MVEVKQFPFDVDEEKDYHEIIVNVRGGLKGEAGGVGKSFGFGVRGVFLIVEEGGRWLDESGVGRISLTTLGGWRRLTVVDDVERFSNDVDGGCTGDCLACGGIVDGDE
jgi:hypothetical protein